MVHSVYQTLLEIVQAMHVFVTAALRADYAINVSNFTILFPLLLICFPLEPAMYFKVLYLALSLTLSFYS